MRRAAAIVALLLVWLLSSPAEACGYWNLVRGSGGDDAERVANVLVHTLTVGKRRLWVQTTADGYEARANGKTWATYEDGVLRRKGKRVGGLSGDVLTIRGTEYQLRFEPLEEDDGFHYARLSVLKDDTVVLSSPAVMAFSVCGKKFDEVAAHQDVVARLAFAMLRLGKL